MSSLSPQRRSGFEESAHPRPEYPNPPLIEAVFEIFGDPPGDIDAIKALGASLADTYRGPTEEMRQVRVQVDMAPQGTKSALSEEPVRYRIRAEDGSRLVQVDPTLAAFNIFPPYSHYENVLVEMRNFFGTWLTVTKPEVLTRLGQRYINQIELPTDAPPSDYFVVYPEFPEALGHPPFALQVEVRSLVSGAVLMNLGLKERKGSTALYLLDLYARSSPTEPFDPDWPAIQPWFDEAHEAISQAFESIITDRTRALFGEGAG